MAHFVQADAFRILGSFRLCGTLTPFGSLVFVGALTLDDSLFSLAWFAGFGTLDGIDSLRLCGTLRPSDFLPFRFDLVSMP